MKTILLLVLAATLTGCQNLTPERQARVDRFLDRVLDVGERYADAQLDKIDPKAVKPIAP